LKILKASRSLLTLLTLKILLTHYFIFYSPPALSFEVLTLENALAKAFASNPDVASAKARASAEKAAIPSQYSLENPRLEWMQEKEMNSTTNFWSFSQEIKFPVKYFFAGKAQHLRAHGAQQNVEEKKYEIRKKVISNYYGIYVASQIILLLETQKETLKKMSKIAELHYSTDAQASQQGQMQIHFKQIKVESDIIMVQQEKEGMSAMLNALLAEDVNLKINISSTDLPIPQINPNAEKIINDLQSSSKKITSSQAVLNEMQTQNKLADWNYAPDFMLSLTRPYNNSLQDDYRFSIALSIPFWFFMKQNSEANAAFYLTEESKKQHEMVIRETQAEAQLLWSKIKANSQLLQIYQTSMLPLVSNTQNSTRSAYRAGKSSFLELLDSEEMLYETKIVYFRSLAQYVENISELEQLASVSLSTLPTVEK